MPRVVRRYEIYLPLFYNDGTPIEPEKFDQVERELVEQFGGVTTVQRQFPLRGVWRGTEDKIPSGGSVDYHA